MKPFDIAAYESSDIATLQVTDAKGGPLIGPDGEQVAIRLFGPGSQQYLKAQSRLDSAASERAMESLRGKPVSDSEDEMRQRVAEKYAACTAGIDHFPVEPLALYTNPRLGYITEQVGRFLGNWANFTKGSTGG